jgi:hypothetical protein
MEAERNKIEQQILAEEGFRVWLRFHRCEFILDYTEYMRIIQRTPQTAFKNFQDRFNYFLDLSLCPRIDRASGLVHGLYIVDDKSFDSGPFELVFETNDIEALREFFNQNKNNYRESYFSHWVNGIQYFVTTKYRSLRSKR